MYHTGCLAGLEFDHEDFGPNKADSTRRPLRTQGFPEGGNRSEQKSKLLVCPLITPVIVPYIIPHIVSKEFRL